MLTETAHAYRTGYDHGRHDERTIQRQRWFFGWLGRGVVMGMGALAAWHVYSWLFNLGRSLTCP